MEIGFLLCTLGGRSSLRVILSGLTGGIAEVGTHPTIEAEMSDGGMITSYAWGISQADTDGAASLGTGSAPTDMSAVAGGELWVRVTSRGEPYYAVAPVFHPVPSVVATMSDQFFDKDGGVISFDAASVFSFGGTPVYSLSAAPSGVTVDPTTGMIQCDTGVLDVQNGTPVVIRLSDAQNPERFIETGFGLTILATGGTVPELIAFSINTVPVPNSLSMTIAGSWDLIRWQIDTTPHHASPAVMDAAASVAALTGPITVIPSDLDFSAVPAGEYYLHMYAEAGGQKQTGAPVRQRIVL